MSNLIIKNNKIFCAIPITGATSKIRVKRRRDNFGNPISVKNNPFMKEDYIEWQISYFLPLDTIWDNFRKAKNSVGRLKIFDDLFSSYKDERAISALKKFAQSHQSVGKKDFKDSLEKIFKTYQETIIVKEHKDNKAYVRYELSDLFKLALEKELVSKEEIKELINFNQSDKFDIEGQYKITRAFTNKTLYGKFEYYEEKSPLFINRINEKKFVEIILRHKQRAVGYQSMIYFCCFADNVLDSVGKSIIGRTANSNEIIYLPIAKEDLIAVAESFIVASKDHAWDMKTILTDIIKD